MTRAFLALLLAAPAAAQDNIPDNIGEWRLGEPLAESKMVDSGLLDCTGQLFVHVDGGKISALRFTPKQCPVSLEDDPEGVWQGLHEQILLQFSHAGSIEWERNAAGDLIVYGEKSAVVLIERRPSAKMVPQIWILPVAKSYICFRGDGFAEFYGSFRKALAAEPAARLVRFFELPFVDSAGKKLGAKTKKEFTRKAKSLLGKGVRTVVGNTKDPECSLDYDGYYVEVFPGVALWAGRTGKVWKWYELSPLATDEEF